MALVLPQARTRSGVGQTTKDLTEHPWAGVDVTMTLIARDEANNEGKSSPHELRLPQRTFVKPLARALVEQRRNLALDAEQKPQGRQGARRAHHRAREVHPERAESISGCARSTGISPTPGPTMTCARWCSACGRWR